MKSLRRYNLTDKKYFITIVTYKRIPILLKDIDIYRISWKFRTLDCWVIMPDHLHFIIDIKNEKLSDVIHNFKITYSRLYRDKFGSGKVWQNRYWDHLIRDESDFNHHIDYIHHNPVKHKYVKNAIDWEMSSFQSYLNKGLYERNWGIADESIFNLEYGE